MTLDLTFHGAAGCVTGFCARLGEESNQRKGLSGLGLRAIHSA